MTDDERAALQRRIATEMRAAITWVRENESNIAGFQSVSKLADFWIAGCGGVGRPAGWAEILAVVVLDDRLRDGLAQVMQTHVMLEELERAEQLATRD